MFEGSDTSAHGVRPRIPCGVLLLLKYLFYLRPQCGCCRQAACEFVLKQQKTRKVVAHEKAGTTQGRKRTVMWCQNTRDIIYLLCTHVSTQNPTAKAKLCLSSHNKQKLRSQPNQKLHFLKSQFTLAISAGLKQTFRTCSTLGLINEAPDLRVPLCRIRPLRQSIFMELGKTR